MRGPDKPCCPNTRNHAFSTHTKSLSAAVRVAESVVADGGSMKVRTLGATAAARPLHERDRTEHGSNFYSGLGGRTALAELVQPWMCLQLLASTRHTVCTRYL